MESDYSSASNIMRKLESQWSSQNNKTNIAVRSLEDSIRRTMLTVRRSKTIRQTMEKEIHHQKKRHLKREEEFRKRLFLEQSKLMKDKISILYKMVGDEHDPTPSGICVLRQESPMQVASPPKGAQQGNWLHTSGLSTFHQCNKITLNNSNIMTTEEYSESCRSAKFMKNDPHKINNPYISVYYDTPTIMYYSEEKTNELIASTSNLRSNKKIAKKVLQSVRMASIASTSKHHEECLDASLNH
jgi:hypothetical protein